MSQYMEVGIISTPRKEDEYRLPIHPDHLERIPEEMRKKLLFEEGYAVPYAMSDEKLAQLTSGRVGTRNEVIKRALVILPKVLATDVRDMTEGATLWGWPHFVQGSEITQAAIEMKISSITWEGMFEWRDGVRGMHTFHYNNEMAGYCSVQQGLNRSGIDGYYGTPARVAVCSFGAVSRGAIRALKGRGFTDITVFTGRPASSITDKIFGGVQYMQIKEENDGRMMIVESDKKTPLIDFLKECHVIVNGTLQNPLDPKMFVYDEAEARQLKSGSVVIDVSCDEGMAFPFAKPTSFKEPTFDVAVDGGFLTVYAVDHSPSLLHRAATAQISEAMLPFLEILMSGPEAWKSNETTNRALEIENGNILNKDILVFQKREDEYPHKIK